MDSRSPFDRATEMITQWWSVMPTLPSDLFARAEAKMLEEVDAACGATATQDAWLLFRRDAGWQLYQEHLGNRTTSEEAAIRQAYIAGWTLRDALAKRR